MVGDGVRNAVGTRPASCGRVSRGIPDFAALPRREAVVQPACPSRQGLQDGRSSLVIRASDAPSRPCKRYVANSLAAGERSVSALQQSNRLRIALRWLLGDNRDRNQEGYKKQKGGSPGRMGRASSGRDYAEAFISI